MNSLLKRIVASRRLLFAVVITFLLFALFPIIPPGYFKSQLHEPLSKPHEEVQPKPLETIPETEPEKNPESKPEDRLAKQVVIARLSNEDISWLRKELPSMPTAIYTVDDPTAPLHPPKNKGHEAMVYLSYLIDHYDMLPDVMIFLHSHRWAWHNNDLLDSDAVQVINALSSPYVQRRGYVNVRCHWEPGCLEWMHPLHPSTREGEFKPEEEKLAAAFTDLFPSRAIPETLAQPCCAQFALSRDFAMKITRDRYVQLRDWLLHTPLPDEISGRIWEYLWQYLFTNQPIVCPRMDICYCDGFGVCFGNETIFTAWFDLRAEQRKLQQALSVITDEEVGDGRGNDKGFSEGITDDLRKKIQEIDDELNIRLKHAKRRGEDPKNRALDSGRQWKEGDGF